MAMSGSQSESCGAASATRRGEQLRGGSRIGVGVDAEQRAEQAAEREVRS